MKIVHFGKFYPPHFGGIESVTSALAEGAAAAGNEVLVICFGPIDHRDADGSVRVRRHTYHAVGSQPLSWRYLIDAVSAGRNADLIHLHSPNMLAAFAALWLGDGPRIVVHWHSDVVGHGLLGWLMRPLERALLNRAHIVLCTSKAYADASTTLQGFTARLRVVPIGVPDPLDEPAVARNGEEPDDLVDLAAWIAGRPLVLSIGRLVPYKGYDFLLEAATRMHTDAAFIIIGTGPLRASLQQKLEESGLASRCKLVGRLPNSTVRALLQRAGVFCLPSVARSEAFGVVLVEAMAAGCPIVATRIPGSGVPWVNLDYESGLNVEPKDSVGLAQALDRIISDRSLRDRLASGARRRFEQLFTERDFVRSILQIYEELRDSRPLRPLLGLRKE